MNLFRRKFLHFGVGAAALSVCCGVAGADTYPSRPVRIIVGFPPGGVVDITARLIAPWLSQALGQQFVVENRPGASGNLGAEAFVRAAPDGYTLFLLSATNAYNATLYDNLKFDFIRDMTPVASIGRDAFVMVVNPSFPAKTGSEFIAFAKNNPGKLNMATAGAGTASDLYGELFKAMADVNLVAVHYRGVGLAMPDLLSGRVDVMFPPLVSAIDYIKTGKLQALGVTTATRRDVLPDVPPIGEFVSGYEATDWTGLSTPASTPPEIVAILHREVNAALADPTFKTRLTDLGVEPFASSSAEFGKFIIEYTDRWAKVIKSANIKVD